MLNFLYHRALNRPFKLYAYNKPDSKKHNIVLLHGLASDSNTWRYVLPLLPKNINPVPIDLVGFGKSPKPDWPDYDTSFHSRQVIYTIKKLKLSGPVTIVGHSMGSLIAIDIAKKKPELVNNLVLCAAPIYDAGEINKTIEDYKKTGRYVTNTLFNIYERLVLDEELTLKGAQKIMKIAPKYNSFTLSKETWLPFKKSLKNTIMNQSALKTITKLKMPIHFINGITDVLIVSKHQKNLAKKFPNITTESVAGGHLINPLAAKKVAKAINLYKIS